MTGDGVPSRGGSRLAKITNVDLGRCYRGHQIRPTESQRGRIDGPLALDPLITDAFSPPLDSQQRSCQSPPRLLTICSASALPVGGDPGGPATRRVRVAGWGFT